MHTLLRVTPMTQKPSGPRMAELKSTEESDTSGAHPSLHRAGLPYTSEPRGQPPAFFPSEKLWPPGSGCAGRWAEATAREGKPGYWGSRQRWHLRSGRVVREQKQLGRKRGLGPDWAMWARRKWGARGRAGSLSPVGGGTGQMCGERPGQLLAEAAQNFRGF